MAEESTTPDVVELVNRWGEAANRRDFDAVGSIFEVDIVWDLSLIGLGTCEGIAAIRSLFEDWLRAYDDVDFAFDELLDVGNGVVLTVVSQKARPAGATGFIRQQEGWVWKSVDGLIANVTIYPEADIDEARAAAELLAQERR